MNSKYHSVRKLKRDQGGDTLVKDVMSENSMQQLDTKLNTEAAENPIEVFMKNKTNTTELTEEEKLKEYIKSIEIKAKIEGKKKYQDEKNKDPLDYIKDFFTKKNREALSEEN